MTVSAFGVDHGYEVEKGLASFGAGLGARVAGGGSRLARSGAQSTQMGRKMQSGTMGLGNLKAGTPGAANYGRGMQAGGRLKSRIGLGLGKVGGAMQRRPGLTGGLVAGGGAAGAGGIGASMFNRKR